MRKGRCNFVTVSGRPFGAAGFPDARGPRGGQLGALGTQGIVAPHLGGDRVGRDRAVQAPAAGTLRPGQRSQAAMVNLDLPDRVRTYARPFRFCDPDYTWPGAAPKKDLNMALCTGDLVQVGRRRSGQWQGRHDAPWRHTGVTGTRARSQIPAASGAPTQPARGGRTRGSAGSDINQDIDEAAQ